MFERGHENRISVVVTMIDGEVVQGSVRLPLSNKLADAINHPEPFLDFVTPTGERCFIAKHSVQKVEPFNVPRADHLERHDNDSRFDPYQILGISKEAPPGKHQTGLSPAGADPITPIGLLDSNCRARCMNMPPRCWRG
jgi:hypothetical protein